MDHCFAHNASLAGRFVVGWPLRVIITSYKDYKCRIGSQEDKLMKLQIGTLLLLLVSCHAAQAQTDAAAKPFIPEPILPGGTVLPLYPADSPHLKRERIHEAERYNTSLKSKSNKILNVLNIHNPSIEVHLAGDEPPNTAAAVILAPGGGHQILWVGPEGADFVPLFKKHGVSTIILRNRLRVDGYNPKTDAVNDAFQAIRLVRAHAAEWKLDPAKIGIMGFSAGAELSAPAALFFEDFERNSSDPTDPLTKVSARPDFVGVIYPGPTPFTREPATRIPRNVPPSFIASAGSGDRVHALSLGDRLFHRYAEGRGPKSRNAYLRKRPSRWWADVSRRDSVWYMDRSLLRLV